MDPHLPSQSASTHRLDPSLLRVLRRLPKAMVAGLSEDERIALEQAIARPSRHAVDVRFLLPGWPQGFYVVLLAGPNRRCGSDRPHEPWTPLTTAIALALGLTLLLGTYGVAYRWQRRSPAAIEAGTAAHPTALPWIATEAACRGAQRTWKDGFCYDSGHKPEF